MDGGTERELKEGRIETEHGGGTGDGSTGTRARGSTGTRAHGEVHWEHRREQHGLSLDQKVCREGRL